MHTWGIEDLKRLSQDTSFLCPAGDWYDFRPHLLTVYNLVRCVNWQDPRTPPLAKPMVVEIGTREGPSTVAILTAIRDAGGGTLTSIECDPEAADKTGLVVNKTGLNPWWHLIVGRSEEVVDQVRGPIDLLLIDGDHSAIQCGADFNMYAPLVRSNGLILFHDYWANIACDEPPAQGESGSQVHQVVDALDRSRFEWVSLPWSYGLTIARKLR